MVGTAPCVVVAQQEKRMRPLPDLGRLALECSTGTNAAEAARDAVVTDNDLLLLTNPHGAHVGGRVRAGGKLVGARKIF